MNHQTRTATSERRPAVLPVIVDACRPMGRKSSTSSFLASRLRKLSIGWYSCAQSRKNGALTDMASGAVSLAAATVSFWDIWRRERRRC